MNLYATLGELKRALSVTSSARDALYLEHLEAASRRIEVFCGREFFLTDAVRYFDSRCNYLVYVDDYVAISALAMDSEADGTYDGETWVQDTDWFAMPYNTWPKFGIELHPNGNFSFGSGRRYIKATGVWGYGDGLSGSPWDVTAITATVADDSGTTLTLSADGVVSPGHTLLVESEQVYVSAVGTLTATVLRGVNGTTAAAHTDAAVGLARYPKQVMRACITLAVAGLKREKNAGFKSERIGDYQYTLADEADEVKFLDRALVGLVKPI